MTDELRDEVTYSDYRKACHGVKVAGEALGQCDPDEAAQHWLPELTRHTAVIFSFVGSNMTARNVPGYVRTVAEYQTAKDAGSPAILPDQPNTGGA